MHLFFIADEAYEMASVALAISVLLKTARPYK